MRRQPEGMSSSTGGIGSLILERRYFEVPLHQRAYAWKPAVVAQYFKDITAALDRGDSEYFVGLIVLVDTDDPEAARFRILDGQQRLATTTMIYSAIRNWLKVNGHNKDADKIKEAFLGVQEYGESEVDPRLVMNVENRAVFQEVVIDSCDDTVIARGTQAAGRHTSTRQLLEAVSLCRTLVSERAASPGEDREKQARALTDLTVYLRDHVQTTCLHVTSPEYAYTIFEALNDRGIDLSVLDLVKNHIFDKAGKSHEHQIQQNWTRMLAHLRNKKSDSFLKAFWTSRHGRIQRGKLFREIKKKYGGRGDALELSRELARVAELYANLETWDSDVWSGHSTTCRRFVEDLSILGSLQTHSVLLSSLERFTATQMEKLLRRLVTLIVRYQVVGRGRTGRLEIKAADVAEGIYSGRLSTPAKVWKELKYIVPPDDEFKDDFGTYSETKEARARYVLHRLEKEAQRAASPTTPMQFESISDPAKVNLEHILPKKPDDSWATILQDDDELHRVHLNRIGNMCLLATKPNRREAARSYPEKSSTYSESAFLLTNSIPQQVRSWNRDAVMQRQLVLSGLAIRAWPLG